MGFASANIRGLNMGLKGDLPNLGMHEDTPVEAGATIDWTTKGAVTPVKNQANVEAAGRSPPLVVLRVLGNCPPATWSACLSSSLSIATLDPPAATVVSWTRHSDGPRTRPLPPRARTHTLLGTALA